MLFIFLFKYLTILSYACDAINLWFLHLISLVIRDRNVETRISTFTNIKLNNDNNIFFFLFLICHWMPAVMWWLHLLVNIDCNKILESNAFYRTIKLCFDLNSFPFWQSGIISLRMFFFYQKRCICFSLHSSYLWLVQK